MASRVLASAGVVLRAYLTTCLPTMVLFHTMPTTVRTNVLCSLDNDGQPGAIISYVSTGPGSVNLYELSKAKTPGRVPIILATTAISFSMPDRTSTRPTPSSKIGEWPVVSSKEAGSVLATVLGAIAIQDNKGGATEIRFEGVPPADPRLTDVQDHLLPTTWRDNILSLLPVARFTLGSFSQVADVARVQSTEHQFPASNSTGLEQVFDEDDATYLVFDEPKDGISMSGDGHSISGMLKGRYYRPNGITRQFAAAVDGEAVYIDRIARACFHGRFSAVRP